MDVRALLILTQLLLAALASASAGLADPFYLRYDADETFPEQEGWSRHRHDPNGEIRRGIEDGLFWLDTRASLSISDFYRVTDAALEPAAAECLRITWRMRTLETDTFGGISDVALGFTNSTREYVEFFLAPEYVSEQGEAPPGEPEHLYSIESGVFHTYTFVTFDAHTYELYVDGVDAFEGAFSGYSWAPGPNAAFGDVIRGRSSLSEWDFVEVAVVPEAGTAVLSLVMAVLVGRR